MPERFPRDLAGFVRRFATEAACRSYLASLRWPEGFVCVACGHRKGWLTARGTVFCASCRRQTSPTAGTVLHGSRVPLPKWFLAMLRACTAKTGLSPKVLQRELDLGSYRTAWLMVRRLRQAMGGVARERLRGKVEVDEILVGGQDEAGAPSFTGLAEDMPQGARATEGVTRNPGSRPAQAAFGASKGQVVEERGPGRALVVIAVELPGRKAGRVPSGSSGRAVRHGRVRMRHVPDASVKALVGFVAECAERSSVVVTDGWRGYRGLGNSGFRHRVRHTAGDDEPGADLLPRVRPVASGLKTWLAAAYRPRAGHAHLQGYLDEFAFGWSWRRSRSVGEAFRRLTEELVRPGVPRDREPPEGRGAAGVPSRLRLG